MALILDQSYTHASNDWWDVRYSTTRWYEAVQFTPTVSAKVGQVKVNLKKDGTPTGNIWVEIWSDNGSNLPLAYIGKSNNQNVASLSTSETEVTFAFTTPVGPLTSGTKYHIAVFGDWTVDGSNYVSFFDYILDSTSARMSRSDNTPTWAGNGASAIYKEYYDDTTIVVSAVKSALLLVDFC